MNSVRDRVIAWQVVRVALPWLKQNVVKHLSRYVNMCLLDYDHDLLNIIEDNVLLAAIEAYDRKGRQATPDRPVTPSHGLTTPSGRGCHLYSE